MLKCTNCGREVPDEANVCGYCDHRLKSVPVEGAVTPLPEKQKGPPPKPPIKPEISGSQVSKRKRNRMLMILLAMGICLLVLVTLVVIYLSVPSITLPFSIEF